MGNAILLHQLKGATAGQWELNSVVSVNGNTLTLGRPLQNTYTSSGDNRAQIVRAYQAEVLDVNATLRVMLH